MNTLKQKIVDVLLQNSFSIALALGLIVLGYLFLYTGGFWAVDHALEAKQAAEAQGYTELQAVNENSLIICGNDAHGYTFTALNPAGQPTKIAACKNDSPKGGGWWIVTR